MEKTQNIKCSRGHCLIPFTTIKSGFGCDNCRKSQTKDTKMYSCREDNYDLCFTCYENGIYTYFNSTGMTIFYENGYKEPDACWIKGYENTIDMSEIRQETKYFVCVPALANLFKNKLAKLDIKILTWKENENNYWDVMNDFQVISEFYIVQ